MVSIIRLLRECDLIGQVREADVKLLDALSVRLICDLMVEMKKAMYGVRWVDTLNASSLLPKHMTTHSFALLFV